MIARLVLAVEIACWTAEKILCLCLFVVMYHLDRWSRGKP